MNQEIKTLFMMAYYPIMYANNRLNGGDFLSVAIPIMDDIKQRLSDEKDIKNAARIIVLEFNNLLNPKMSVQQIDELVQTILNPGPITRATAKQIADEFVRKHQ